VTTKAPPPGPSPSPPTSSLTPAFTKPFLTSACIASAPRSNPSPASVAYDFKTGQQIPKYPGINFTQQSIVFRAKGKIVNLILMIPGGGVPRASMLALATYTIFKSIDTLKDPT
jgi:hypothetical protein